MIKWERLFSLPTAARIKKCEKTLGVTFPPLYRHYLQTANGGVTKPFVHFSILKGTHDVRLGSLYGIADKKSNLDLETAYEFFMDETSDEVGSPTFPRGYIPVGDDPGNNLLLLMTKGKDKEAIFYWDCSDFYLEHYNIDQNVFRVADNIDKFINSLQSD